MNEEVVKTEYYGEFGAELFNLYTKYNRRRKGYLFSGRYDVVLAMIAAMISMEEQLGEGPKHDCNPPKS